MSGLPRPHRLTCFRPPIQDRGMTLTPYYEDFDVTIYHGDAREILPHIDADVMVTDPPYGYAYASNREGPWKGQQIANDADLTCRDDVLAVWGNGRPALVFGSWKRDRPSGTRNTLVWDKGETPGMGDLAMPWGHSHEEIYVLGGGFKGRRTGSVLRYQNIPSSTRAGRHHPNEKPVGLMRDLLAKCPAGVIVDPFMGSGSTLRAAKDLGRKVIGIDVDERWCALAVKRVAQEALPL